DAAARRTFPAGARIPVGYPGDNALGRNDVWDQLLNRLGASARYGCSAAGDSENLEKIPSLDTTLFVLRHLLLQINNDRSDSLSGWSALHGSWRFPYDKLYRSPC